MLFRLIPTALTIRAVYSICAGWSRGLIGRARSHREAESSAFARTSGELSMRTISSVQRATTGRAFPAGRIAAPVEGAS